VAPPSLQDAFHFEFTVHPDDYHRIDNGFPELRKLAAAIRLPGCTAGLGMPFVSSSLFAPHQQQLYLTARFLQEFDPPSGRLARKLTTTATDLHDDIKNNISHESYRLVVNSLESLGQLPAPVGPIIARVEASPLRFGNRKDDERFRAIAFRCTSREDKPPTCLIVFGNGNHQGTSVFAQYITENPEHAKTVVALDLGLTGRLDSERKVQRLAQNSSVSVFTMVNGVVKTVVQREPLSTSGGEIQLWLSDLVKDHKGLSEEFVRPLHARYVLLFSCLASP
jgi:hypothetical protein